jgi:hypothetical protein
MTSPATDQQRAIQDEVAALIVQAMLTCEVIQVAHEAARLSKRYSASGLSAQDIAEIIVRLASPTHVAIESRASVA